MYLHNMQIILCINFAAAIKNKYIFRQVNRMMRTLSLRL